MSHGWRGSNTPARTSAESVLERIHEVMMVDDAARQMHADPSTEALLQAMAEVRPDAAGASSHSAAALQAAARASELSVRRARLTERIAAPRADLNQAQQRLDLAVRGALQAAERAALARERAALAHDGAAELHDSMAARGIGEVSWHVQESRRHRAAAEADRRHPTATIRRTAAT
jgi:hypothetical protein